VIGGTKPLLHGARKPGMNLVEFEEIQVVIIGVYSIDAGTEPTIIALGILLAANRSCEPEERRVKDARKVWVEFPRCVDDLFRGRSGRNKSEPSHDPHHVTVGRNVNVAKVA
jgi:hypothetical protein